MQGKLCPSTAACPVHCVGLTNTTFHNDTSETLLSTEDDLWNTCLMQDPETVTFAAVSGLLDHLLCSKCSKGFAGQKDGQSLPQANPFPEDA